MNSNTRREQHFVEELKKWYTKNKRVLIPRDEYHDSVNNYLAALSSSNKTPRQHYLMRKYEVMQCGHTQKLIRKRANLEEEPVYFVSIEDTFDIIKRCHLLTGHGGRDKMVKELSKKYANITSQKNARVSRHKSNAIPSVIASSLHFLQCHDFIAQCVSQASLNGKKMLSN